MDVLVVGAGTMGRWFARALGSGQDSEGAQRDVDATASVAFADVDPATARSAAGSVGGRAVDVDGDERFDAVCVAVPISEGPTAIAAQAHRADRALLDLTGAMDPAVEAMREHGPALERVSLHPLFASENAPGNVAVVADAPGPVTDDIRASLEKRGNHLFETTPATHDRAMETVQARAHAAVLAFGLAAEEVPPEFHTAVSGPLRELVERVTHAGNAPGVYAEIQAAFDGAEDVAEAARRVADADEEAFEALYREAAQTGD